jgi:2'-5' RNA ligase
MLNHPIPHAVPAHPLPPTMLTHRQSWHLHEYLLVVPPQPALKATVKKIRENAAAISHNTSALQLPVHLTLASFSTPPSAEQKLLLRLRQIASTASPFKINAEGYSVRQGQGVYLNLGRSAATTEILTQLRGLLPLMKAHPEKRPYLCTQPAIPIATRLLPWQHDSLWPRYAHCQTKASLTGECLLLLKRPPRATLWQIVERLPFENQPPAVWQKSLFERAA